jgi:hypothetical protein
MACGYWFHVLIELLFFNFYWSHVLIELLFFNFSVMLVALNRYHTALVLVFAVFTCNEALKSIIWNIMGQPSPYLKNYAVFLSLIAYPSFFDYRASNHW